MNYCYYHTRKSAQHTCTGCGHAICDPCTAAIEGESFCLVCANQFVIRASSCPDMLPSKNQIPWHQRGEIGSVRAFFYTANQVIFHPTHFFAHLPNGKDIRTPLLFAITCILLFWFPMQVFYIKVLLPRLISSVVIQEGLGQSSAEMIQALQRQLHSLSGINFLIIPVSDFFFYILLSSLLQQVMVWFFHGRRGYVATLQIRCYAMVLQGLWVIPFLGVILAEIGTVFICSRGFQVVQKLSPPRALFVATVPALVTYFL